MGAPDFQPRAVQAASPSVQVGVTLPGEGLAIEIVKLIGKLADGQTPEQKKQFWDWFIEDHERWRKLWGLEE